MKFLDYDKKRSETEIKNLIEEIGADKVGWSKICSKQTLSEDFIREYQDYVDWFCISIDQKLSEDFIREFQNKVYWEYISANQNLSKDFIREFQDRLYWRFISRYQNLSESFIREFQDRLDWYNISMYQELSGDFIREFQNEINWRNICAYQVLTEDFIREFNIEEYLIAIQKNCGSSNRTIHIFNTEPEIIHLGCFKGTREEAVKAVKAKYGEENKACKAYIKKVNLCFEQAKQ